jgi:hypothetical protein
MTANALIGYYSIVSVCDDSEVEAIWIPDIRFQAWACLVQPKPVSVRLEQIEFRVLQNLMAP